VEVAKGLGFRVYRVRVHTYTWGGCDDHHMCLDFWFQCTVKESPFECKLFIKRRYTSALSIFRLRISSFHLHTRKTCLLRSSHFFGYWGSRIPELKSATCMSQIYIISGVCTCPPPHGRMSRVKISGQLKVQQQPAALHGPKLHLSLYMTTPFIDCQQHFLNFVQLGVVDIPCMQRKSRQ